MFDLPLKSASVKTLKNGHKYYIFPPPGTHKNQKDRRHKYATDPDHLPIYRGPGSNGKAKMASEVLAPAQAMMTAMLRYGERIDDWSLKSAFIQNGYRPDDAAQGAKYLQIIKSSIREAPKTFGTLEFPSNLEQEAQGILGMPGDSRRSAFHQHLAAAPGWNSNLVSQLFQIVDNAYAPRGANAHTTSWAFDLDFYILKGGIEQNVGADTHKNAAALQSAAGMWLNTYSMFFGFDSYDTGKEVFHQEFRDPKSGPGSSDFIALLNCCQPELEFVDDSLPKIREAIRQLSLGMINP